MYFRLVDIEISSYLIQVAKIELILIKGKKKPAKTKKVMIKEL